MILDLNHNPGLGPGGPLGEGGPLESLSLSTRPGDSEHAEFTAYTSEEFPCRAGSGCPHISEMVLIAPAAAGWCQGNKPHRSLPFPEDIVYIDDSNSTETFTAFN